MARLAKAALLATALGLIAGTSAAGAAVTYVTQTSTGASIVPGTTDIGNHGDDTLTTIALPFPVSVYGQTFTSARASSNGNLQFTTSDTTFTNACLPAASFGVSIMPNWDDLYLVNSGFGIFTSVTGVAPHRIFNIEWRAQYFPGSGNANFEVRLREDSPVITVIYGTVTSTSSVTAGVQASGTGPFTQFNCNGTGGTITSGLRVDYLPSRALNVLKGGGGTGTVTSADPGINCGATCGAGFADGTNEVLTATPDAGSRFAGWIDCDSQNGATCTMSMTSDKTVTATFNAVHTLSVATTGSGSGSVSSNPSGVNCGAVCSVLFDEGTAVTLTAAPGSGSTFTGWSGGGCSGTDPCVVTMSADQNVSANFDQTPAAPPAPPGPPPVVTAVPGTTLDNAKINQDKNSATFTFEALPAKDATTSGFECALIKKAHGTPKFKGCTSPKTYKHLKPRRYLFEVRAVGPAGPDATPAKKRFRIR
jgi:hypothetical protein